MFMLEMKSCQSVDDVIFPHVCVKLRLAKRLRNVRLFLAYEINKLGFGNRVKA